MNVLLIILLILVSVILILVLVKNRYKKKLHETSEILANDIMGIIQESGIIVSPGLILLHTRKLASIIEVCFPSTQWLTDLEFFVKGSYKEVKSLIDLDPQVADLKRTIEAIKRAPKDVEEESNLYMLELTKKQATILYYTLKKLKKPVKPIRLILAKLRTIKNN